MTDTILQSTASTQRPAAGAPVPVPDDTGWPNIHAPDTHVVAADLERARPHLVRRLRQNPSVIAGGLLLLSIVVAAALAPLLYPEDPLGMVARPLLWPGQDLTYPLGTDSLGRDVAAGLMHGARVSLLIGFVATTIGLTVGILIGAT